MKFLRVLTFLLSMSAISGCASLDDHKEIFGIPMGALHELNVDEAGKYFSGKTLISKPYLGYGSVVYFGTDSKVYLWEIDQSVIFVRTWNLEKDENRTNLCTIENYLITSGGHLIYNENIYRNEYSVNLFGRKKGRYWFFRKREECKDLNKIFSAVRDVVDGDVFALSSGKLPFILSYGFGRSAAELKQQLPANQ